MRPGAQKGDVVLFTELETREEKRVQIASQPFGFG